MAIILAACVAALLGLYAVGNLAVALMQAWSQAYRQRVQRRQRSLLRRRLWWTPRRRPTLPGRLRRWCWLPSLTTPTWSRWRGGSR